MPRITDRRLQELERRARLVIFDPPAVCRLALEAYNSGAPLPANLDERERALALVYLDALRRTERIFPDAPEIPP